MDEDLIYRDFEYANHYKLGELTGRKIIKAVCLGDLQEVERLLKLPVEKGGLKLLRLTAKDNKGRTAKEIAKELGNELMIKLFE